MSNSSLVSYTKLSPNNSGVRTMSIDRITPHCFVGQVSVERMGESFIKPSKKASCNYGIGKDGRIGLYVDETHRSWCSSSSANDQRSVTIECASDNIEPYKMTDAVYNSLIKLCVDICKRNGKNVLMWFGDKNKTLAYEPKPNEMILTVHRWFSAKACPGDWLYSRLGRLAESVTNELNVSENLTSKNLYRVQIGAFSKKFYAEKLLEKIRIRGFSDAFIKRKLCGNGNILYKVQVGSFSKREYANRYLEKVKQAGFSDAYITTIKNFYK